MRVLLRPDSMNYPQILGVAALMAVACVAPAHSFAQAGAAGKRKPVDGEVVKADRETALNAYATRPRFAARGRLAKIDLDADFDGDGIADNNNPADNGPVQKTPPGLVVAPGELVTAVIRAYRYPKLYSGEFLVALSVDGVNRSKKSGDFESMKDEVTNTGGIRVWADPQKTRLLLDSRDPDHRLREWSMQVTSPSGVPSLVYVEGVVPSKFSGDVRLMMSARPVTKSPKVVWTYYDHILLTVAPHSHVKADSKKNSPGSGTN
jgi:hypothetical protein